MKYILNGLLIMAAFVMMGCGSLDQPDNPTVKGGKVVATASAEQILKGLLENNVSGITEDTELYGYTAYSIPYETTDEEGNKVQASGLMTVPTEIPDEKKEIISRAGFSVISDDHGTIFANREAPTVSHEMAGTPQGSAIILTAMNGFVTLQPDYIGFGDSSDHYHPYMLKKSLANSTIDFIRAARKFAEDNDIPLNPLLFVTGYSEGGYAAMATMQMIESNSTLMAEMGVAMSAPMAGPYALDYMTLNVLASDTLGVPSFMADVAYAYTKAYNKDLGSVINEPYASKLEDLFSGDYDRIFIDEQLTHKTKGVGGLFDIDFSNDVLGSEFADEPIYRGNPNNWFMQAVSMNSVYRWVPKTPMALVQCESDDVIPYELSRAAYGTMVAMGATTVQMVPVESTIQMVNSDFPSVVGHGACGEPAYMVTAGIFAGIRKDYIGY